MSWVELILVVGELAAAATAVGVAITKIAKPLKAMRQDVSSTKTKVEALGQHEEENYMSLLRLTVMSSDMPLSERLAAGEKYLKAGGNGDVKAFILSVDKEYREEVRK